MSSTYRPGDIAMVTSELDDVRDEPGVFLRLEEVEFWSLVSGKAVWAADADEVGPVLGNVADIAAMMTKAHEAFEDPIDLDDPYTVAYVKGRNHRLDEIQALQGQARKARGRALADVRGRIIAHRDAQGPQHYDAFSHLLEQVRDLSDPLDEEAP